VSAEIQNFKIDLDVLALLTDYRLDDDPETVRLTYEFRPVLIWNALLQKRTTTSSSAMAAKVNPKNSDMN
jgi:hypothetical protein